MATEHPDQPPILVRPALPSDHEAVARIIVDVFIGEGYTSPAMVDRLRDVAAWAGGLDLLVAVDSGSGEVVGTASLIGPDRPLAQIAGDGEAEVRLLATRADTRARGVGGALVRECIERATRLGCGRLVLSTQTRMTAAHRLYGRFGLERMRERDWIAASGRRMLVYGLRL
jgi:ribosomal protein S18 acetylase RimI-like enzyme